MVLVAGGTIAAVHSRTSPGALTPVSNSKPLAHHAGKPPKPVIPVGPLKVVSVSPHSGTRGVNGATKITVKFSSALAAMTPVPVLSPKIDGTWRVSGRTATFTPKYGFQPETKVTVKIPGGPGGVEGLAPTAGILRKTKTVKFTTGSFATLRLQQVLTQLGYLPLTWTPDAPSAAAPIPAGSLRAQVSAAYAPGSGTFAFKPGYPSELTSQWKADSLNMLDQGAIMAFESNEGLTMDGVAGPQVWANLLQAAAKDKVNPNGYTYALANQKSPETLTVWHNGQVIEHTLANTGIPGRNTQDGTFTVYLRYQFNYMNGTNPDGSKYHDPVYWISYFHGGDAVHYFARYSYGYYQSLGCVEVPWNPAKKVWGYMTYGTLVTVIGPMA
jgi:peptidoglycan hydrolase-like protein with peptidoglycan-binding domain